MSEQNDIKGIILSTMALNSIIFCANEIYESSYVETAQIPIRIKKKNHKIHHGKTEIYETRVNIYLF